MRRAYIAIAHTISTIPVCLSIKNYAKEIIPEDVMASG